MRLGPNVNHINAKPPSANAVLLSEPWHRAGWPPKHDLGTWIVTDDWPNLVLTTNAELDVFEAWFATSTMNLFGPD